MTVIPTSATTYTASSALLVRSDTGPKLVMLNGMVQTLGRADQRMSITRFQDFTYDLGALITGCRMVAARWTNFPPPNF